MDAKDDNYCTLCKRWFANAGGFQCHIGAKSNADCAEAYYARIAYRMHPNIPSAAGLPDSSMADISADVSKMSLNESVDSVLGKGIKITGKEGDISDNVDDISRKEDTLSGKVSGISGKDTDISQDIADNISLLEDLAANLNDGGFGDCPPSPIHRSDSMQFNYTNSFEDDDEVLEEDPDGLAHFTRPHPFSISECNKEMSRAFKKYCEEEELLEFDQDEVRSLDLIKRIADRRMPMNFYEEINDWFKKHTPPNSSEHVAQQTILNKLASRYNEEAASPKVSPKLTLPYSKAKVNLVRCDAKAQLVSMLTDPRVKDSDYLFHNNNPFCPPPDPRESNKIGDINTGLAYYEAYHRWVKDPYRDVILPIIFYIDGAISGQFQNLPIEALKMINGLLKQPARDNNEYASRNLGYVTSYIAEKTQGKAIIKESIAMDADAYLSEDEEVKSHLPNPKPNAFDPEHASADWHFMLDYFLQPFYDLQQEGGFEWDFRYRNKTFPVRFIPVVLFVKGDTQEHDKHCGHYLSRTHHVKQLCRYCTCPAAETDDPYAGPYELKSPKMLRKLVKAKDLKALKLLSQQCIEIAWYKLYFAPHNSLNIHGASPLEILHWIQVGKFKSVRNMFFVQIGETSKLAKEIDALACSMGFLFQRQSERDLPRTHFSKGIRKGKLMAHEFSGVMLVLCAVLRSTRGRQLLNGAKQSTKAKKKVGEIAAIRDWILLLESLLQWEQWLKSKEMNYNDVERYGEKVKELMNLEKTVGNRQEGMKFRTIKFHGALHNCMDILNLGVPTVTNSSPDEKGHKRSKTAAKRTQRIPKKFDEQCSKELHRMHLVDLAATEMETGQVVWDYYERVSDLDGELHLDPPKPTKLKRVVDSSFHYLDDSLPESSSEEIIEDESNSSDRTVEFQLGGTKIEIFRNPFDTYDLRILGRMKGKKYVKFHQDFVVCCANLLHDLRGVGVQKVTMYTEYTRAGHKFRASPSYRGKVWRDWAIFEIDGEMVPCHCWGFVDLRSLTAEQAATNKANVGQEIYAIVESTTPVKAKKEVEMSELFVPYRKDVKKITRNQGKITRVERKFWLVDVDTIHGPCCMIPDIGNTNPKCYLRLRPREEWGGDFVKWLQTPHTKVMTVDETDEELEEDLLEEVEDLMDTASESSESSDDEDFPTGEIDDETGSESYSDSDDSYQADAE